MKQSNRSAKKVQTRKLATIFNAVWAAIGSGFLPLGSFWLVHHEVKDYPYIWLVVAAALLYSAPTVASWAATWACEAYLPTGHKIPVLIKSWCFSILLEGVLVCSHTPWLSATAVFILSSVNMVSSVQQALRKKKVEVKKVKK